LELPLKRNRDGGKEEKNSSVKTGRKRSLSIRLGFIKLFKRRPSIYDLYEQLLPPKSIVKVPRSSSYKVLEEYHIYKPYARAVIVRNPAGQIMYFLEEIELNEEEMNLLKDVLEHFEYELRVPKTPVQDVKLYISQELDRILSERAKSAGLGDQEIVRRVRYYALRDLVGLGPIDPLLRDPYLEDISFNGVGQPVFVWHQKYEYIPSNIIVASEEALNDYIMRLAYLAGKHVSIAFPIVDAILPGGHRMAATYAREVSPSGGSLVIRKFREEPITIVDLISSRVLSSEMAAYLWLLIEYKRPILISGGTGVGKTTLLNAVLSFVKPGLKIVTIEDIPELRLQHDNWVRLTSRESYALESGGRPITLFDLVKLSLRYRPDYIVVGEIRGEEANVLFQAIATGHGGATTLHAESFEFAVKRLASPPINVPPAYLALIDAFVLIKRVVKRLPDGRITLSRRVESITEIKDYDNYKQISSWIPESDGFTLSINDSSTLRHIATMSGVSLDELVGEVQKRASVLNAMVEKRIRSSTEVSGVIYRYYYNPTAVLDELGIKKKV